MITQNDCIRCIVSPLKLVNVSMIYQELFLYPVDEDEENMTTNTSASKKNTSSSSFSSSATPLKLSGSSRNKQFKGFQTIANSNIKRYGGDFNIHSSGAKLCPPEDMIDTMQVQNERKRRIVVLSDSSEDEVQIVGDSQDKKRLKKTNQTNRHGESRGRIFKVLFSIFNSTVD